MIVERVDIAERVLATDLPSPPGWALGRARSASVAAAGRAEARLSRLLGEWGTSLLGAHFPDIHSTSSGLPLAQSIFGECDLRDWLRREPRVVAGPGVGGNADIEFRDSGGKLDGALFGDQLEPGADRFLLHAGRVVAALDRGVTLGVRHLDRSSPALGDLCNDLVAVSGADTFTKLFVSAGTTASRGGTATRRTSWSSCCGDGSGFRSLPRTTWHRTIRPPSQWTSNCMRETPSCCRRPACIERCRWAGGAD
jgi:hypothetical protein